VTTVIFGNSTLLVRASHATMVNIVKVAPFALGAAVAARAIIRRGRGHARAASASATPPVPPVVRPFSGSVEI